MTDRRSTATSVFDQPRQAVGWLATRWAGSLIVLLVWAVMVRESPTDTGSGTWWSAASTILLLGLGVLNVWGFWASSDAAPRLREVARQRELSWWARDRLGEEEAAARLGWAPGPVVLATRMLMAVAVVTTLAAATVLVLRWA